MGSVGQYTQGWLPWKGSKANTNWSSRTQENNDLGMGRLDSSSAQNDEISWDIWLDTGTWKYAQVHVTTTSVGTYSVQLDAVEQGTIDGYSGSSVHSVYNEITGITVSVAGLKTFKLKMATKNGSSSAYYGLIQSCAWIRTSGSGSIPAGTDTPGYTWHYLPWMGTKTNTNYATRANDATYLGGGYLQGSGAQNDEWSTDIWLDAGTYKYAQIYAKLAAGGIYSVQLDTVEKGTIDSYNATTTLNNYTEITGITVSTAAVKSFKIKMATKNGSATNYYGVMNSSAWIRTGA